VELKKKYFELKKNLIFLAFVTPGIAKGSLKKFSQFGSVVWQAVDINIYEQSALLYR